MKSNSPKSNLRSFRYSDEVATILEAQEGSSLNDKFEALVLLCFREVKSRQKELQMLQEETSRERKRLYDLRQASKELQMLEGDLRSAQRYLAVIEQRAKKIAETDCNTD